MNDDYTDVLLLEPVSETRGLDLAPPPDAFAIAGGDATGAVLIQIFAVEGNDAQGAARISDSILAPAYRRAGLQEEGLLKSLTPREDNFPALLYRTDGPFLVWIASTQAYEDARTGADRAIATAEPELAHMGLRPIETSWLQPTPRSRMRSEAKR